MFIWWLLWLGLKFGTGKETNEHRIETRTKQIQFGKNTIGYDNYCAAIPRWVRYSLYTPLVLKCTNSNLLFLSYFREKRGHPAVHPRTPDPTQDISKRAFDGYIKSWRRALHLWDNGEVRPDLNPELVKVQVKKPSNDVKFDEEKALGQKRKISSEEPDGSDTELANETYANKLRKQQVELELGTERDEYAEAEERDREEEGEDLMEDGYISDDVL